MFCGSEFDVTSTSISRLMSLKHESTHSYNSKESKGKEGRRRSMEYRDCGDEGMSAYILIENALPRLSLC
jgi:hypothetical protein